jgi:endoglucanase
MHPMSFPPRQRWSLAARGRPWRSRTPKLEVLEDRVLLSGSAFVRVNQVGYVAGQPNQAMLMTSGPETGATYQVLNASGQAVASGTVGSSVGSWSSAYPDVYVLDFSSVTTAGTYSIVVHGPINAVSPSFHIGSGAGLYAGLLSNALFFYQAQQDGPNVNSAVMNRQPSHLNDEHASVYKTPTFDSNDQFQGSLVKVGGPVDVSGGWFDAGDYLKFVETASYSDAVLLMSVRNDPSQLSGGSTNFAADARGETDWLLKMWNDQTRTLYDQVGVGNGNSSGTLNGDHDIWRLPQADDGDKAAADIYIQNRPVFEAGPAGSPISPNLAGRLAADFALASQVYRSSDPTYANQCLLAAEHVFDLAKTTNVGQLTTTAPYDFYPETEWRDDLELGGTELYYATSAGNLPPGQPHTNTYYLQQAARWAQSYINNGEPNDGDSLNLYDVSGLAHYELYRAIGQAGNPSGLAVTQSQLLADLKGQVDTGVAQARKDPFGLGYIYFNPASNGSPASTSDPVPHALGLALEASFYDDLTGTSTYARFGAGQLNFVLGDNAWGTSFIVGAGSTYPRWLASQIPNLDLTANGTPAVMRGATVDGPDAKSEINQDLLGSPLPGMNLSPSGDPFKPFDTGSVAYMDNPQVYNCVEPADDYTALTVLLFTRLVKGKGWTPTALGPTAPSNLPAATARPDTPSARSDGAARGVGTTAASAAAPASPGAAPALTWADMLFNQMEQAAAWYAGSLLGHGAGVPAP